MALAGLAPGGALAQAAPILAFEGEMVPLPADARPWTDVIAAADGRALLSFPLEGMIRLAVVDDTGAAVETVRLPPSGAPNFPNRIGWLGDSIWAIDRASSVAVVYDDSWSLIRTIEVALPGRAGEVRALRAVALLPEERLLVETQASAMALALSSPALDRDRLMEALPLPVVPAEVVESLPLWITGPDGSVHGTLAELSRRGAMGFVVFPQDPAQPGRGSGSVFDQPFRDDDLLAIDPAGGHVVVVHRSVEGASADPEYGVHLLTVAGDTVWSRGVGYDPIPLRQAWLEEEARTIARGDGEPSEDRVSATQQALYAPRWLPPVSAVVTGPDRWTWLRREEVPGSRAAHWDILDPEGRRVGAIVLRSTMSVRAVHGLEAWAMEPDADGSRHLWHVRVQPSSGWSPAHRP